MTTPSPILITGIPRSGATMIAATINYCGAFGGEMSKRGMYSNDRIRNLMKADFAFSTEGWKTEVEYILSTEGYRGGVWMYKDFNISNVWKLWDSAYPEAKWVIVRRKTTDIISSCMKTKYMKEYNTEEGWKGMVHDYEHRFVEMITEGLNCKVIWPERMVGGDYQQLYELCEWVGLEWKEDALRFIETLLWKTRQKERSK